MEDNNELGNFKKVYLNITGKFSGSYLSEDKELLISPSVTHDNLYELRPYSINLENVNKFYQVFTSEDTIGELQYLIDKSKKYYK